jgi:23S rRNA pseudouridine2605 synthase
MPRRNESGPERKGSSRSGGGRSNSGRGRSTGKPFKKFDKDDTASPRGRSSGSKRNFSSSSSARGERKPKSDEKSFKKSDTGPPRSRSSSKPFGQRGNFSERRSPDKRKGYGPSPEAGESETKGSSKRSRFAPPNPLKGEQSSSSGRAGSRKRIDKKPFSGKVDDSKFQSRNKPRFSDNKGGERRKERGESFGKPYKRTYKTRPDREGSVDTRRKVALAGDPTAPKSDKIRSNKFIANSGLCSRREADELITMGLISVNGKVVSELGYKVNPGDEVRYEDKVLRAEKPVYILMNKPKGFLTTTDDPQERKTVMHIIGSAVKERIYPVGRLDRNTTGLLLLTNDGDLADKLMHPSFNVKKVYKVELDKPLAKGDFQAILEGVRLEEGRAQVDDLAIVSDDGRTVGIELHIGWNRVVRRIFESLGYEVIKLDRSVYAGLDKKELGRGQWRFLSKEEIIHLKHFK